VHFLVTENTLLLSQRLLRMLDGLNFKEFVSFLSAFSPRATLQQKIECNDDDDDDDDDIYIGLERVLQLLLQILYKLM
jgi:serine/threonine-protein phosphatase 2B regulatory subunit